MVDSGSGAPPAATALLQLPDDVRELVDSVQDVFYRVDAQDRLVAVSRSALRVLGYESQAELLGRLASTFWARPERRAAFLAALDERGELNDYEADLLRRDGSVAHVATTVRRLRDQAGAVIGYQGIWRDIGERKRAEEALRHSEEKFAKVFLTVPDTITISRIADGKLLDVNPGFEKATGWPRAEALGRTTLELNLWVDPRQREHLVERLRERGELLDGDIAFRRRDGAHRQGVYSARSIVIAGEPCVVFIMRDVTERRRAQAALRLQEGRFLQALDGAELGTWDLIVETRHVVVNDRWAEMLGYRREEVLHAYSFWEKHLHPDDVPRVQEALKAHLGGLSSSYEVEFRLRHRDGHWVWVLAKGRILERDAEGRPYRMCGTHLDISARKQLEAERISMEAQLRQAQRLEAVGQVAGGVAHDFNNLLTVQLANLRVLAAVPELSGETRDMLSDVERAAEAAADLTRQLLAFGRRQVLQPLRVDLNEFVPGFLKMLRRVVREDVRIVFEVPDRPHWVDADVGMLQQVLLNLAVNAQDAMPSGGVLSIGIDAVEVVAPAGPDADQRPGRFVRLMVADTGHGMDDATMRRAFDPFFTTKPVGKGTGLGLATIYGIVKQHGGFIGVQSAPGKGAEFRVHWPRAEDGSAAASPPEEQPSFARGHGELVLLVEDAQAVRRALRATLLRLGYEVVEAADADEALALCRDAAARVDVLLSDVVMPGLGGIELAQRLRQEHPTIPVVLMSGYSPELAAEGLPDGVRFLKKPVEPATLASVVRAALEQSRSRPLLARP
jgi:PAS domain S-box-containing protein